MDRHSPVVFCLVHAAFLVTGVVQTLFTFEFRELGFTRSPGNLIGAAGNPAGQLILAACSLRLWRNWERSLLLYAIPIVVLELGCAVSSQVAVASIGAGMYQAVHCSVVALNAALGLFLCAKKLDVARWGAVALIVISVAVASADVQLEESVFGRIRQRVDGFVASIAATGFSCAIYLVANWLLEKPWGRPVPKPLVLAQMIGTVELAVIAVYFCVYVIPRWDALVTANMRPDASTWYCVALYCVYVAVSGVHQYAFYYACSFGPTAAVTAAVNKCVQAALLLFFSHFYCDVATRLNCLSWLKVAGAAGAVGGALWYGYAGAKEGDVIDPSSGAISLSMHRAITCPAHI